MIGSPWQFEPEISDQDLAKVAILMVRWSHIEHYLANCLRVMLRLTEDEAVAMSWPLPVERRIAKIAEIAELTPIHPHAMKAFKELRPVMQGLITVRNNVVHAILLEDEIEGHVFHLRSKRKNLTKEQLFATEELTNYAAHLCQAMRFAIGFKNQPEPMIYEWPDRPVDTGISEISHSIPPRTGEVRRHDIPR